MIQVLMDTRTEFAARIAPYLAEVHSHAARLTGSGDDAEDLVQECLAAAFVGIDGLKNPEVLGAWLLQILRRKWYDILRRRVQEREYKAKPAPVDPPFEDAALVRQALSKLDAGDREVLELRFFRSKNSNEAGAVLGKSPGTVRSMIFYALRRFETAYRALLEKP